MSVPDRVQAQVVKHFLAGAGSAHKRESELVQGLTEAGNTGNRRHRSGNSPTELRVAALTAVMSTEAVTAHHQQESAVVKARTEMVTAAEKSVLNRCQLAMAAIQRP